MGQLAPPMGALLTYWLSSGPAITQPVLIPAHANILVMAMATITRSSMPGRVMMGKCFAPVQMYSV